MVEMIAEKIFQSVKIAGVWKDTSLEWDVLTWVRAFADLEKPHMVVQHLHGKKKDAGKHYHVVCVPQEGKDHLKLDKEMDLPHPLRKEKRKPFQTKSQKYDANHFKYLIKPTEWNDQGQSMVLMTSFSDEELTLMAQESADYFDEMKQRIPRMVNSMVLLKDPAEFHINAVNEVLRELAKDDKKPGPWVTHSVRAAVWSRHSSYEKYIAKLYR